MGKVIVDAGAWQLAMNVLRRDAAAGAEIVKELEKATVSLSDEWRFLPTTPTPEMLSAGECESDSEEATYETVFAAMVAAAPLPPNVEVTGEGPQGRSPGEP